jgi:thiazole synthase ThiGH ThiG subunit
VQTTDKALYDRIVAGSASAESAASGHEAFVADRAEMALRTCAAMGCRSQAEVLEYLGKHFRVTLPNTLDVDTDIEACVLLDFRAFSDC